MSRNKAKKDLYHHRGRECGQGYEDDECVSCTWVMGLDLGMIACGKGLIDSKSNMKILGPK